MGLNSFPVTNSRAVKTDGRYLTFRDALFRSLTRMVPLETLSFLLGKNGFWHDAWSKTIVIEDRR